MAVIAGILGWTLITVAVLVVLVCILPLRIELALRKGDTWSFRAALRPCGGLGPRIVLRGDGSGRRGAAKKRRGRGRSRQVDPARLLRAGLRLMSNILERVEIDRADIDMAFGLGDPADTGQAYGMLMPLVHGTRAAPKLRIQVKPMFDDTRLRGRADLRLSLIPVLLLTPLARFGWVLAGART